MDPITNEFDQSKPVIPKPLFSTPESADSLWSHDRSKIYGKPKSASYLGVNGDISGIKGLKQTSSHASYRISQT